MVARAVAVLVATLTGTAAAYQAPLRRAPTTKHRHRCIVVAYDRIGEARAVAKWVDGCGGATEAVTAEEVDGCGLGLVTTRPARRGDILLSVPLSLGLSAESALRSSIGVYLAEFEPELADYAFIALALLHERRLGDQSELGPWLITETLLPPGGFDDLPLLWDAQGLADLDAATVAGAGERSKAVDADYEWLKENVLEAAPVFFPESVFSIEAYRAAVALAVSRSVPVTDAEGVPTPMLLPLFELPNHDGASPDATVQSRVAKAAGLFGGGEAPASAVLVATADLAERAPVCVRYGGDTAGELFVDHGFVNEPVPAAITMSFALKPDELFLDEKLDVLDTAGLP